jgi:hypothetical protein
LVIVLAFAGDSTMTTFMQRSSFSPKINGAQRQPETFQNRTAALTLPSLEPELS